MRVAWSLQILDREIDDRGAPSSPSQKVKVQVKKYHSSFKTLQNVHLDSLGDWCYSLEDFIRKEANKGYNTLHRNAALNQKTRQDNTRYFFYSATNTSTSSTVEVQFYTSILIESRIGTDIVIDLSIDSITEKKQVSIKSGKDAYLPIQFCCRATSMQVRHKTDQNIYVDSDSESSISFSSFFMDSNMKSLYDSSRDYCMYEEEQKTKWEFVYKKDIDLKINDFTGKGEKNYFVATIALRKIKVVNSLGNDYTYCYKITLHPQLTILNYTPRKITLSVYNSLSVAQLCSKQISPGECLMVEGGTVNEKTSIIPQLKHNFGKSKAIFPFQKMKQKKRTISVLFVDDKTGENNRLVLKFEIRKMSEKSLEIIIYSPFLILNETDFNLHYRSGNMLSKVEEDIARIDGDWAKKIEEVEKQRKMETNQVLNSGEKQQNSFSKQVQQKEVLDRVISTLEMFGPEEAPKSMYISLFKQTWSNKFKLSLDAQGVFEIKESQSDRLKASADVKGGSSTKADSSSDKFKIRHLFKFFVHFDRLEGIFNKSQLIVIQPHYIIKNND